MYSIMRNFVAQNLAIITNASRWEIAIAVTGAIVSAIVAIIIRERFERRWPGRARNSAMVSLVLGGPASGGMFIAGFFYGHLSPPVIFVATLGALVTLGLLLALLLTAMMMVMRIYFMMRYRRAI